MKEENKPQWATELANAERAYEIALSIWDCLRADAGHRNSIWYVSKKDPISKDSIAAAVTAAASIYKNGLAVEIFEAHPEITEQDLFTHLGAGDPYFYRRQIIMTRGEVELVREDPGCDWEGLADSLKSEKEMYSKYAPYFQNASDESIQALQTEKFYTDNIDQVIQDRLKLI